MTTAETITHTDPIEEMFDPRKDSNLGFMACFHRRYALGDEVTHPFAGTVTVEEAQQIENTETCPAAIFDGKWEPCIVLPLYLYDHSGITMNTTGYSCPWDSGRIGIIYASYSGIRKFFGCKRITAKTIARAKTRLLSEVEEYDRYIRG
jgi:hypothetical protein